MNKRKFPVLLGILAVVFLLSVYSCEDEKDIVEHKIELRNGSGEEVHMWISGESIDPSNKLSPGASRVCDIRVERTADQTPVSFNAYAGKNGQTLTSGEFEADGLHIIIAYSGGSLVKE